ncbi:MAG: RluA family pseudouridine synthase [Planctomycetes bacterium]|nr:RluA family pseudouridine synthase [Planctomycetota bacterium]
MSKPEFETYRCRADDDGLRIERVLARRLDLNPDRVGKLLRQKRIWRAGDLIHLERGDMLRSGDLLELREADLSQPKPPPQANRKIRLKILHEDEAMIVINKAARRVVHPGPQHSNDSILNGLIAAYPELIELGEERGYGLVHRLDKDTSGVLVVARTAESYDAIRAAFAAREVEKRYAALVRGTPPDAEGTIDTEIDDKEAITKCRLDEQRGPVAKLTLWPKTGRTHQLRIHLAGIDCPVLADTRYGTGLDDITARLFLKRQALHAESIELTHPSSGARVSWEAPWPGDLRKAWQRATKAFTS